MATAAPVLETARLRLRPLAGSDIETWSAVTADPDVVRYLGGAPQSREETARRILATVGSWSLYGYGYWAVTMCDDDRMIGHAGFADFDRDMQPSIAGKPEMGWVFAPEAQGRGLAGEAVQAALAWADAALGEDISAIIDPGNRPSIRLAEKNGFSLTGTASYRGAPILLFHRRSGGS